MKLQMKITIIIVIIISEVFQAKIVDYSVSVSRMIFKQFNFYLLMMNFNFFFWLFEMKLLFVCLDVPEVELSED